MAKRDITTQAHIANARLNGYAIEYAGRTGSPLIASPGKFENEHPRALALYESVMGHDTLSLVTYADSTWQAIVTDSDGEAYHIEEDDSGFVNTRHVNAETLDARVRELDALDTLLWAVNDPDFYDGVKIADPADLDALPIETKEALFVNDHGNASLFWRDACNKWECVADIV